MERPNIAFPQVHPRLEWFRLVFESNGITLTPAEAKIVIRDLHRMGR